MNSKFLKKSIYQNKIDDDLAQCLTCERRCKISNDKVGFCGTRINKNSEIYTIVYGLIPALSYNFIEKKPLYHFYPGSLAITIGTYGCNFSCIFCQNHHISHPSKKITEVVDNAAEYVPPEKIIELAITEHKGAVAIINM